MSTSTNLTPIVSKLFCSSTRSDFTVRNRPHVVNGGGFVVTDRSQKVVFRIDGCGTIGIKGQLILRDSDGAPLIFIRREGGIVLGLSVWKQWKGHVMDYEGAKKVVFSMKEPKSCVVMSTPVRVCMEPKGHNVDWDFEIKGSFANRNCSINDRRGNIVAKVGAWEGVESTASKDVYRVVVQPYFDQAFVFGVIAVLDYIYNESTRC